MKYKKYNEYNYALTMKVGENIIEQLKKFLEQENLGFVSFYGVGAFSKATLAGFSIAEKKFHNHEVPEHKTHVYETLHFTGNLTWMKNEKGELKPHFHAHTSVSCDDGTVQGGHVMSATCGVTMELVMTVLSKEEKEIRHRSEELQVDLWTLE